MRVHELTLKYLESKRDRLVSGVIIVFDKLLVFKQFPVCSLAYQECSFRSRLKPSAIPLVSFSTVLSYQP